MTIISEFTGSPAIPELGLKTVDLKLEVHSFQTDFRDLQTLDRIFRPVFGFGTRVYRGISIRIGRKAMTLGGDSSKAAIARSSAIQVWID